VAQDIDDEQTQVKALLLAVHGFIGGIADKNPPLYASGHEPESGDDAQQQPQPPHHGILGGVLGGGMMGGGMFGGYYGGGFGQAMEMGMAMNLGASLVNSIFR
jgi:predicted lipid-binding transport protein (Tim44 family)